MKHRSRPKSIYQITTYLAAVILLLILFVLGGFFFMIQGPAGAGAERRAELMAQLADSRQYWQEKRPAAFRYVVDRDCVCDEDVRRPYVATERGVQRSAEYLVGVGQETPSAGLSPPEVAWIADLFDLVERAVSRSELDRVSYDARFGYPSVVIVAPEAGTRHREIRVRDFEVISYD